MNEKIEMVDYHMQMRRLYIRLGWIVFLMPVCFALMAGLPETPAFAALTEHPKIQGPTPPTPPRKPVMQGDGEIKEPEKKLPAAEKEPTVSKGAEQGKEKVKPAEKPKAPPKETVAAEAEKTAPPLQQGQVVVGQSNAGLAADKMEETEPQQKPEESASDKKGPSLAKVSIPIYIYLLLFAILGGAIFYIYRRMKMPANNDVISQEKTLSPQIAFLAKKKSSPAVSLPKMEAKIRNKSLLEQLIKYDMDTYGEIRSDLSYDEPYWVEHLIRKHGKGDKEKINRALLSYYEKKNNQ